MEIYLHDILRDAGVAPSFSERDVDDVIALLRASNKSLHLCSTQDKASRWFSHYTQSRLLDSQWHLLFGAQPMFRMSRTKSFRR
jgi:hypothetical protein